MLVCGPGGPQQEPGIWVISVVGGELRKLHEGAWLATPSPDGSLVAFISPDYNEIWIMNAGGQDARRVRSVEKNAAILQVAWAPDGQRLAYLKNIELTRAIESCDLKGAQISTIWTDARLQNFCWTRRGRMIATLTESGAGAGTAKSNLWTVNVRDGRARGSPSRLSDFAGFTPLALSVTADEKSLALIRSYDQSDVYVGELEANGSRLSAPRRLTLDERIDWPAGWTRDGSAVLFYSDRQGSLDLFRQRLQDRAAELVLPGPEEKRQPQLTPDGASILYLAWQKQAGAPPSSGKIMRLPVSGGPPLSVTDVKGYPGSAQVTRELAGMQVLTTRGYPDLRCPSAEGKPCILAESEGNKIIFSALDPAHGRNGEIARLEANGPSFWDISPDGSKIVWGEVGRNNRVRILPVDKSAEREVPVTGFRLIGSAGWSNDGLSLFLAGVAPEGGSVLRHVNLGGGGSVLYKTDAWLERPLPSPNGRYLAFGQATSSSNVWAVEKF